MIANKIVNNIFIRPADSVAIEAQNTNIATWLTHNLFVGSERLYSFNTKGEGPIEYYATTEPSNIFAAEMPEAIYLNPPLIGSPLIDAGSSDVELLEDLQGNPRPTDGDNDGIAQPDIGPFEYQPVL